jgi:hypothetical protein
MATRAEVRNTRWSNLPDLNEDVIERSKEDIGKVRKGVNPPASARGGARDVVREAGRRAGVRLGSRAGLATSALQGGYDVGRMIDEETGAGKKLVDATGLGRAAEAAANKRDKVTLTKAAKERLEDMEDAEIARKVDEDIASEKSNKREVDYKKGGSVKGWGQARGARKAKVY